VLDVVPEDAGVVDQAAVLKAIGNRVDGVARQNPEDLDRTRVTGRIDLAQVPQADAAGDDHTGHDNERDEVGEPLDRPVLASSALDDQRVGEVGVVPRVVAPWSLLQRRTTAAHRHRLTAVARRRASVGA
jgi:hypothetical protein